MKRFDVYWVNLDPTIGSEIKKIRPCVIVSPDEINSELKTVVVTPITKTRRNLGYRLNITHDTTPGSIACDQIRCIDKKRLLKTYGRLKQSDAEQTCTILETMFSL